MTIDIKMSAADKMRACCVTRWGIVATNRPQSVAEHAHNVALLTDQLAEKAGYGTTGRASMVAYCIYHDLAELYTGDMPSPYKQLLRENGEISTLEAVETAAVPQAAEFSTMLGTDQMAMIKLCDIWESAHYIGQYGVDPVTNSAFKKLLVIADELIKQRLSHCPILKAACDSLFESLFETEPMLLEDWVEKQGCSNGS